MQGPVTISVASTHYVLRTLEVTDKADGFCGWLEDAETAALLNRAPVTLTPEQFRGYVQRFDRVNSHLLGIFRRDTGTLVGVWSVYVDWAQSRFVLNLLVGDAAERNRGVRLETADLVHRQFFEVLGLKEAHCSALESNMQIRHILDSRGWRTVSRDEKPAPDGITPVGILHFVLPRDVWRRRDAV